MEANGYPKTLKVPFCIRFCIRNAAAIPGIPGIRRRSIWTNGHFLGRPVLTGARWASRSFNKYIHLLDFILSGYDARRVMLFRQSFICSPACHRPDIKAQLHQKDKCHRLLSGDAIAHTSSHCMVMAKFIGTNVRNNHAYTVSLVGPERNALSLTLGVNRIPELAFRLNGSRHAASAQFARTITFCDHEQQLLYRPLPAATSIMDTRLLPSALIPTLPCVEKHSLQK